jgi:G:T-mismatch repair DNA endonuclease (very short patch repair protein)
VYATESLAEEAAEDHADADQMRELGWENVAVREFEIQEREEASAD